MSAYMNISTQMTDQECLAGAMGEIGYVVQSHATAVKLKGWYSSNDRKAELVIPRNGANGNYAEIGFARNKETGSFDLIIDDMEQSKVDLKAIKRVYTEKRVDRSAQATGQKLVSKEQTKNAAGKLVTRMIFQPIGR